MNPEQLVIRFKKVNEEAVLPKYAHADDAGFDLFSLEDRTLMPGEIYGFNIGIASEIQPGYAVLFKDKSSLGSLGIHILAGVIDSGYRGEWRIILINLGKEPYEVKRGNKIAQGVHLRVEQPQVVEIITLSETERGSGGFGSTGR